jgi:penicillin-binding protein 1C
MPRHNLHLAALLLTGRDPGRWRWGAEGFRGLPTHIDPQAQAALERALSLSLSPFPGEVTGAGAIMEAGTGRILAYLGNARPQGPAGQVDCAQARRSPGSALKPFIYMEAFAGGRLNPLSLLADTTLSLSGLAPRNFDLRYRGPVSAGQALSQSLNVPAIRVLGQIGQDRAKEALRRAGISVSAGSYYGHSLALGGLEASLVELLRAYGGLAGQGRLPDISFSPEDREEGRERYLSRVPEDFSGSDSFLSDRALSQAAAYLVTGSLRDDSRLPLGLAGDGLAFKTGTSHGFRDAWFCVYDAQRVMVLWLGEPQGQGRPGLSGMSALSAQAVGLMRQLGRSRNWPPPPRALEPYRACPLSGEPAGPHCPGAVIGWRIKALANFHPCRLHRRQAGRPVVVWPPELAAYMLEAEGRAGADSLTGLRVVSPVAGRRFLARGETASLPLKAEGGRGDLWWYLDGEFFGRSRPQESRLASLPPGPHTVSVIDGRNRPAISSFTVQSRLSGRAEEGLARLSFD